MDGWDEARHAPATGAAVPGIGTLDPDCAPRLRSGETAPGTAPAVSVIIACHNGAATLAETLASLVIQRWDRPWEIVFADNGSTDGSAAIFADCAARHPWIAMRHVDASERRGKVHALNKAICAAHGRSLLFCDADDTVAPGWLDAMGAALDREPFVAARMDIRALNPDWTVRQRRQEQETGLGVIPHAPFCAMAGGATLGFHRAVFEAVGGFDPAFRYMEDDDFCVRAALAGFTMRYVPDAVYNYRFRADIAAIYAQGYNYGYYRGLMRRRYAPGNVLAPRPWLSVLGRIGTLQLRRLSRVIRCKPRSPEDQARLMRALGGAVGDLWGSLAFGVAPPLPRRPKTVEQAAPPSLGHFQRK